MLSTLSTRLGRKSVDSCRRWKSASTGRSSSRPRVPSRLAGDHPPRDVCLTVDPPPSAQPTELVSPSSPSPSSPPTSRMALFRQALASQKTTSTTPTVSSPPRDRTSTVPLNTLRPTLVHSVPRPLVLAHMERYTTLTSYTPLETNLRPFLKWVSFTVCTGFPDMVRLVLWAIRVTSWDRDVLRLLWSIIDKPIFSREVLSTCDRPPPDELLAILVANKEKVDEKFKGMRHPLGMLVEQYAGAARSDLTRLDPTFAEPALKEREELKKMRKALVGHVTSVHETMREWAEQDEHGGNGAWTKWTCTTLMKAYAYAGSFEDVQVVWDEMGKEGGVGRDQRAVAVYFDACGYCGALPQALSAWAELTAPGPTTPARPVLDPNNYASYYEALNRCGAWSELFYARQAQRNAHLLTTYIAAEQNAHAFRPTYWTASSSPGSSPPPDSSSSPADSVGKPPPLTANDLALDLLLADRLVKNEHRRTTDKPIDRELYIWLRKDYEHLVGPVMFEEVLAALRDRVGLGRKWKGVVKTYHKGVEYDEAGEDPSTSDQDSQPSDPATNSPSQPRRPSYGLREGERREEGGGGGGRVGEKPEVDFGLKG